MKKLLLSAFVAFAMLATTKSFAQQGFGTNQPDKSAAVDIVSSQRGLLIPRINLTATNVEAPVINPAQSLLVYNKLSNGTGANAVTPGFYYWDTDKWVRIVSTSSEKITKVESGNNVIVDSSVSTDGIITTYKVSVAGGTNGQVLVTVINPSHNPADPASQQYISDWVDVNEFIGGVNGITITKNPTTGVNEIGIGGALTDATGTEIITDHLAGKTLAIQGLQVLNSGDFNPANQNIVIMGADGILKQVAPKTLIEDAIAENNLAAKALSSAGGIITLNGSATTPADNSVLKNVVLGVNDRSIGPEKLNPGTATPGQIATVINNGTTTVVEYQDPSIAIGKTLTTDNIIGVGTNAVSATASSLNGAVLTPTYLKIKDDAITAAQIAPNAVTNSELAIGAVTADKMQSKNTAASTNAGLGTVPVADGVGGVTYQSVASAAGENLTTDGKIVIGTTGNSQSLTDAVLVPTHLRIAPESITSADILNGTIESTDIKDGTIQVTDIKAPGTTTDSSTGGTPGQVLVTDVITGDVKWVPQSSLANKDNYNFAAPLAKDPGVANTVGGKDYNVTIATASTTLGVVKQAATSPEVTIATDGTLSINKGNVVLAGDVTGPLNATVIANNAVTTPKINDDAVTAAKINADVAGAGLKQNATTGALEVDLTSTGIGKGLSTDSVIEITGTGATSLSNAAETVLKDINLRIGTDKITATHIAADAVGASELADNSVASANIIDGSVANVDLANGSVTADKMQSKDTATGSNVAGGMVPTSNGSGGVTYQTPNSLVNVNNGISKGTGNVIQLGGDLIKATAINTAVGDTGFTLAVTGLTNVAPTVATKNKVIVAETTGGILRTVDKVVYGTNVNIAANTGYSFHTPEVVINVTLANVDQTITFPSAASAEGQVINVRIANPTDTHTGYLYLGSNNLNSADFLAYGSMPYQAWIVKSNGTAWEIVGRN